MSISDWFDWITTIILVIALILAARWITKTYDRAEETRLKRLALFEKEEYKRQLNEQRKMLYNHTETFKQELIATLVDKIKVNEDAEPDYHSLYDDYADGYKKAITDVVSYLEDIEYVSGEIGIVDELLSMTDEEVEMKLETQVDDTVHYRNQS